MPTGTITAFDKRGQFGAIDADDGRVMIFNVRGAPTPQKRGVEPGTQRRV